MKRYSNKLLSITDIVVADAFFSTSTFEKGMSALDFCLVSRFRDNACLHYSLSFVQMIRTNFIFCMTIIAIYKMFAIYMDGLLFTNKSLMRI